MLPPAAGATHIGRKTPRRSPITPASPDPNPDLHLPPSLLTCRIGDRNLKSQCQGSVHQAGKSCAGRNGHPQLEKPTGARAALSALRPL